MISFDTVIYIVFGIVVILVGYQYIKNRTDYYNLNSKQDKSKYPQKIIDLYNLVHKDEKDFGFITKKGYSLSLYLNNNRELTQHEIKEIQNNTNLVLDAGPEYDFNYKGFCGYRFWKEPSLPKSKEIKHDSQ